MNKNRIKNLENKFHSKETIYVFGIVPKSNEVHNDNNEIGMEKYQCDSNIVMFGTPTEKQMLQYGITKL